MPPLMLPETFMALAAAFVPCFTAPTYRTFCFLVAGWVHCVGRHTVTGVALAAGVLGWRHISACHRFFARVVWHPDHLGLMVFRLALRWVPAEGPRVVLADDTVARKGGKAISLGSMHHDPLRSTMRKAFSRFGHVWVVLALWVPLPFGPRGGPKGIALPLLFRRYVGSTRGNRAAASAARAGGARTTSGPRFQRAEAAFPPPERRPTTPQRAREESALVAQWAAVFTPGRTVSIVGDTVYTNRTTMEGRPPNVEVAGHMRLDAARFTPPGPRQAGQRGRSRKRGTRLPTPHAMAATRTERGTWHRLRLVLYGKTVRPLVFRGTAGILCLWSIPGPDVYFYPRPYVLPQYAGEWEVLHPERLPQPADAPAGAHQFHRENQWMVRDLLAAVEEDRQPLSSGHDGRAAVEMIVAVYASHVQGNRVSLPLVQRTHPLAEWTG